MFLDCAIQKTASIAFTVSLEGISTPVGQHEQTLLISALQLGSFLIRYWPCVWPWVKLIGSCSFHKRDVSYPRSDIWELLQRLPVSLPTLLEVLFHLLGLREQFLPASACLGEVMNHASDRDKVLVSACWVIYHAPEVQSWCLSLGRMNRPLGSWERPEHEPVGSLPPWNFWSHLPAPPGLLTECSTGR